jgi:predicted extracellular nuclease
MPRRLVLTTALIAAFLVPGHAQAAPGGLVVNEVDYDQPGSDTAEFVELRNSGSSSVDLTGYRLRFVNGANGSEYRNFVLSGTVAAGDYFVLCANGATVANCDQDVTPETDLIQNGAPDGLSLLDAGGAVVDSLSYEGEMAGLTEGAAGAPADTGAPGESVGRVPDGCDTDDNAADFEVITASPGASNGGAACGGTPGDAAPAVASTDPADGDTGVDPGSSITVTFTEPVTAEGAFMLTCTDGQTYATTVSGDGTTYTLDPAQDLPRGEQCTLAIDGDAVHDVDAEDPPDTASDRSVTFSVAGLQGLRIHDIQGIRHVSPYADKTVQGVPGVVTAVNNGGFWMQDPQPDGSRRTSEGIFVFRGGRPAIGSAVRVSGLVQEFRPGNDANNLTTTEISNPAVTPAEGGSPIAPTLLGRGGLRPPLRFIDDDSDGDVEQNPLFDPWEDGIDFHESLEGMLVQIRRPEVVGPTNGFDELPVVSDGAAKKRTRRDGVIVSRRDFNPERFILDDGIAEPPDANVGDGFDGPVRAVVDYSFGNFKYVLTEPVGRVDRGLRQEVTQRPGRDELATGSMNVENLAPTDAPAKYERLARILVEHMRSPDLVAVEEVQDNDGATNSTVTDASLTWERFIAAVEAAGGPTYEFSEIDPVDDQDGGQPGGNIRVGFLYRTDRGLSFVERPGGTSTDATHVVGGRLTFSPGRVEPQDEAWENSRKPLAGEFRWRGRTVIAVANHFNSKGGDQPLFGRFQPPERSSEVQRHKQATVLRGFVREALAGDRNARVVVMGDLNDFEFSRTLDILESAPLENLMETLPKRERYSYVFDGNSQTLDQILVTRALRRGAEYDSVHVNAEFHDQASDHDPQVARLQP